MTSKTPQALGVDLVDIERIETALKKYQHRFLNRIFTPDEITYCLSKPHPAIHFAARFAAKEAISKALGTGIGKHLGWQDITITSSPSGKPSVSLSAKASALHGNPTFLLSLSHTRTLAIASVLLTN